MYVYMYMCIHVSVCLCIIYIYIYNNNNNNNNHTTTTTTTNNNNNSNNNNKHNTCLHKVWLSFAVAITRLIIGSKRLGGAFRCACLHTSWHHHIFRRKGKCSLGGRHSTIFVNPQ